MINKKFQVIDEMGLHARPASMLVSMASKFKSDIDIEYKTTKVTLKSVMLVMSLGVGQNEEFTLHFDGEDEEEAFNNISEFLFSEKLCK